MINYTFLAKAIEYYKNLGYREIETPWVVPLETMQITLPEDLKPAPYNKNYLVGSAEQGFLDLRIKEKIIGKFVSTTPCFRINDCKDSLHQEYFMKTELFRNDKVSALELQSVIKDAFDFYSQFLAVKVIQLKDLEFDIVDVKNGIELGSYGMRGCPLTGSWIYGTGLAEPRLSLVMRKQ
jgi:hypothetical protein